MFHVLNDLIERKILDAQQQGMFDNLPGTGRPFRFDPYEWLNQDSWLGHNMMKNAGCLPVWIELAKEIDALEDMLDRRARRRTSWIATTAETLWQCSDAERRRQRPGIEAIERDFVRRQYEQLEDLRQKVDSFNERCPIRRLEKPGVWTEHLIKRFIRAYEPISQATGWNHPGIAVEQKNGSRNDRERARRILDLERAVREMHRIDRTGEHAGDRKPGA